MYCSNVVQAVFMTTLFVIVIVHFIEHANPVPVQCEEPTNCAAAAVTPTNGAVIDECDTGNACTMGYYFPDYGVCIPKTMPNGTACTDVCYQEDANTTCNDLGVCTGSAADCRGYCESDFECNATIPLSSYWLSESGNWDVDTPVLWGHMYECFAGRCELFTLDLYWRQDAEDDYGEAIAGHLRCEDFLNVTWTQERAVCLFQEDFLLDRNLTDAYFPGDQPERPSQFRMCTFHYKCAPFQPLELKRVLDEYDYSNENEAQAMRRLTVAKKMLAETKKAKSQQKKRAPRH